MTLQSTNNKMDNKHILTRDVFPSECSWLDKPYRKGTVVYRYNGREYGCINDSSASFTKQYNKLPIIELPSNSVKKVSI